MANAVKVIAFYIGLFVIAWALFAMAACMAEDTVTPAVQVDESVERILPSRPQPIVPDSMELQGRRRDKDDCDCEKKKEPRQGLFARWWNGPHYIATGFAKGVGRLFFGAGDAIAAYLGFPMFVMRTLSSLIWLGVFALVVVLIRTFKGK